MNQIIQLVVELNNINEKTVRFDQYLASKLNDFSRSYIQKLIKDGNVLVNGILIKKPGAVIKKGDSIEVSLPELKTVDIKPEQMDLDIVYEDSDVILVNKPKDMVVHPAPGYYEHTLVNGLMYHCGNELSGINGELRPGIVHRIDKDTTGLLVVCKNDIAHRFLADQLAEHSIKRTYQAIVHHNFFEDEGVVDAPIGRHPIDRKKMAINPKNGKEAVTHYKVLNHLNHKYNHIECRLETGRTHQIRVHMTSINHPLLGDDIYGPKTHSDIKMKLQGQTLHAKTLGFIHPTTKKFVEFDTELPEYFTKLLAMLEN